MKNNNSTNFGIKIADNLNLEYKGNCENGTCSCCQKFDIRTPEDLEKFIQVIEGKKLQTDENKSTKE